jgi:hypothetical protein
VRVSAVEVPFCTGFVWDGARSRRSRRGCLVRVGNGARSRRPVELASYESDLVRGRGVLSLLRFNRFVFLLSLVVGILILLVPTVAPEPLGECVVTLSEAYRLMNWSRSVAVFSGGGARAHPPGVASEASVECLDSSEVFFTFY